MATATRKLFVNLAVKNVKASTEFFRKLGFAFNPQFTDDNAACMIVNEHAHVMLLAEPFFKTFTTQAICDTSKASEALFCLSAESRDAVDQLVKTAHAAGGKIIEDAQDRGMMYDWSFVDLDGHHWGVMWMDPSFIHQQPAPN